MSAMSQEFNEKVEAFRGFLMARGAPNRVVWIAPEHAVYYKRRWLVFKGEQVKEADVMSTFQAAREKPFGVRLMVVCADDTNSYCYLSVPTDQLDADYKLLASGHVKFSVPEPIPVAAVVKRRFFLAWWYRRRNLKTRSIKELHFDL